MTDVDLLLIFAVAMAIFVIAGRLADSTEAKDARRRNRSYRLPLR